MTEVNYESLYMWFKIYQITIKSDAAKFDFLAIIRKHIPLSEGHEAFYVDYAKKNQIWVKKK